MDIKEKWKKVKGYPYKVSSYGKVKRTKSGPGTFSGRILKQNINNSGYLYVNLCKDGKIKKFMVHRLVACCFIGQCPKNKEVNHKDGDKLNNKIWNLEYLNAKENTRHAIRLGLMNNKGENSYNAKLTKKDVLKIRRLYETGKYTQKEIAKMFSIVFQHVSDIVNYKKWKCLKQKY